MGSLPNFASLPFSAPREAPGLDTAARWQTPEGIEVKPL